MMPTPDKEIIRADNNCRRRTSTAGEEQLTLTASARTIDIDRERARSRIFLPLPPRAATKAFSPLFFSPPATVLRTGAHERAPLTPERGVAGRRVPWRRALARLGEPGSVKRQNTRAGNLNARACAGPFGEGFISMVIVLGGYSLVPDPN